METYKKPIIASKDSNPNIINIRQISAAPPDNHRIDASQSLTLRKKLDK